MNPDEAEACLPSPPPPPPPPQRNATQRKVIALCIHFNAVVFQHVCA